MRVILKRVPKKTNHTMQHKMLESWYELIVENYAPQNSVPVMRATKTATIAETEKGSEVPKCQYKAR